MFTFINSESLYIGTDTVRFNNIRDVLSSSGIRYKLKVRNINGNIINFGRGTMRGTFGNFQAQMNEYEILVYKKDYEKAKFLVEHS